MKCIWRFFAVVCLVCPVAMAQNAQLSGLVKDKTGAVIPQAHVTLTNLDTASVTNGKTDRAGFFVFTSVQPGRYDLDAEAGGFDRTVIAGMKLDTAANVSQDIMLRVMASAEEVTITQQAGQLNTEDGSVSTVIHRDLIENMPLNGNDLTTLFELSPGTVLNAGGSPSNGGGFSVDGQRPTANYLTIDGASGNGYITPEIGSNNTGAGIATSASGGTNGILPVDAIEEYRMDTSTYTAENGRTPGGQIQVRTRSGTNQFHGTLFENFRNQVLNAEDWFTKFDNVPQEPLRMNEFGGTLGGPIVKNNIFFFVANDNLILHEPNLTTQDEVPDMSVLAGAYSAYKTWLSIFPRGNGGQIPGSPSFDYLNYSYPSLIGDHTTSARVDWQLPHSIHAFVRANISPSSSVQPAILGTGSHFEVDTYTGGLTIPLSGNMLDDIAVNHISYNTKLVNLAGSIGGNNPNAIQNSPPPGVSLTSDELVFIPANPGDVNYAEASAGDSYANQLHQLNIVNTFTLHHGKHTLKLGIDFLSRQTRLKTYSNYYDVEVEFPTAAPYSGSDLDTGLITSLSYATYKEQPIISLSNTSAFINDDFKIASSLTFNAGVRWEYNPAASVGPLGALAVEGTNLSPQTFQADVTKSPLYKSQYANFAPRFGFAWTPRPESGLVVRGGAGIYFDTGQAAATAGSSAAGTYPYQYSQSYSEVAFASVDWTGLAGNQAALPVASLYLVNLYLLSPRTYEWSFTIERSFGKHTKLTTSYVGNDGEKLIGEDRYYNARNVAGQYPVNTVYVKTNGNLYIITNESHSNYQALQAQLVSKVGQRFSALASYTWGHAEDDGSTDYSSVGAAAPNPMANSANDIRQIFGAAIHYAPTGIRGNHLLQAVTGGWALDTIARLQSASPITVTFSNTAADNVNQYLSNADAVVGQPAVLHEHIDSYGRTVPGNRLLNHAAFTAPPISALGAQLRNGDSQTNGYRLFGLKEWDLAASRSWKLIGGLNVILRIDAFNLLNTVNFADVSSGWTSANGSSFGRSGQTYASYYGSGTSGDGTSGAQQSAFENGGPRELQLSLKLKF